MNEKGLEKDLDSPPKGCAYSPDGKWFVSSVDGALRLWRCETDSWVTTIAEKLAAPVVDCTFSPKGDYIVAKLATGHLLAYPSLLFTIDSKDGDSPRTPNTDSSSAKGYEGISFNKWFGSKTRQTD